MSKSIHSPQHVRLRELLVAARRKAGMTQEEVASKLCRPQSFVAKYEGEERRLDVIEFISVARAIGSDPVRMLREVGRAIGLLGSDDVEEAPAAGSPGSCAYRVRNKVR